jgi:hypothetical protein
MTPKGDENMLGLFEGVKLQNLSLRKVRVRVRIRVGVRVRVRVRVGVRVRSRVRVRVINHKAEP